MLANSVLSNKTLRIRMHPGLFGKSQVNHKVVCNVSTAWESWSPYMEKRAAPIDKKVDDKVASELSAAIKETAQAYKPKSHTSLHHSSSFKVQHVPKISVADLPKDLHDRLETVSSQALVNACGHEDVDTATFSYTTTDVNAALCITGIIHEKDGQKLATVSFVATETERQASWSRLEGLILHWACSEKAGGSWMAPPSGWSASGKTTDAGSIKDTAFTKQTVPGSCDTMYVLVLQLPVREVLKSGGISFVLKASLAQNTKWLKDAETSADFFLDISKLPIADH